MKPYVKKNKKQNVNLKQRTLCYPMRPWKSKTSQIVQNSDLADFVSNMTMPSW